MTPLACPSCGASFRANDIDRSLGIASCHACGEVLDLRTRDAADEVRLDALTRPAPAEPIPLPPGFRLTDADGQLEVRWRWFHLGHVVALLASLMWNVSSLLWLSLTLLSKKWEELVLLFPHVVVGLGLGYWGLAGLMNAARLTVSQGELSLRHGPLPWPGNVWAREHIAQLYGEERPGRRNPSVVTWALCLMTRTGRRHSLVTGLTDKSQARWLERTLEARLNIVDAPVQGEMPK